jgi:hypothetical protein
MNLDDLTYGQLKAILDLFGETKVQEKKVPFKIGELYLIRTVTFTLAGKVKEVCGDFLVLENADWVADTGRFSESLKDQNNFSEVEPFLNDAIVALGAIVDATIISKLINKVK